MAMDIQSQLSATDRGSFFKLVDAFASELGELKQEMVEINQQEDKHPEPVLLYEMEGEVSGLYLQCPTQEGERDCGSASWASRMSVLDRLMETHPVWLLLSINEPEAISILLHQPPGAFLVRRSPQLQSKVLSVRVDDTSESPVTDYPVKESQYTFALEDSGISFADLFHLVAFYCVSRDVLPFTLRIPEVIAMATTQAELEEVAQLGAGFWRLAISSPRRSPPPAGVSSAWPRVPRAAGPDQTLPRPESSAQPPPAARVLPTPHQRGSSHAALCFINPLFLHIHHPLREDPPRPRLRGRVGCPDGRSRSSPPPPPLPRRLSPPQRRSMPLIGSCGRARQPQSQKQRLMGAKASSTDKPAVPPPWPKKQGEALEGQRFPIALDEETIARALSRANLPYKGPAAKPAPTAKTVPWTRRTGSNQRLSDVSLSTSTSSDSLDSPRVPPPGLAEDSSDEDVDEDGDEDEAEEDYGAGLENDLQLRLRASRHSKRLRRGGPLLILPRALKGRFRKVSGVFNSLMTPERRAVRKITELSRDKGSYFGCLVQDYMSFLQENYKSHTSSLDMLQTLRQFLTQMKAYLQQSSELDPPIESLIPEDQIDHVLERAMHKCVLKPLQAVVEAALHDFQVGSGAWQQLVENLALAKARQPHELGVEAALPPDAAAIEKIRHKFQNMRKMYSPEQKVTLLLRICKLIYTIMQEQSGRMFGADDFLPMLTYVVAQCDMPQLDTEIQYMMELLEPSLLHGEGGYYLTSVYGAMALIKNFQEEQAARILSLATRNTLHQWHQRRTTQRNTPSVEDFQNYLRVALQDVGNGCTAKTLQVLPYATTEEVCRLCAKKFRVADPESHALFLLTEDTSQQLAPDTHPQLIKAEFHSRPQPQPFHFVYRRVGSTITTTTTTTTTSHTEQRHNGNCPPA